mgnify:CR=1 FL=1
MHALPNQYCSLKEANWKSQEEERSYRECRRHVLFPCYSILSAISCAKCNTRIFLPLASTPPCKCIRHPGLSATSTVAPVLSALFSLLFIMRSDISPCSIDVAPPKLQHTSPGTRKGHNETFISSFSFSTSTSGQRLSAEDLCSCQLPLVIWTVIGERLA